MAGCCLRKELTSKSVTNGVSVNVRREYCALGGVDVLCPLVMYLRVSEFVDAFDVVNCFLLLHVCVKESGSCVVGQLA